jgi:chromosomal replication initiator protein
MAQEVIRGEQSVAEQVVSSLIERIGRERFELWVAEDTQWTLADGCLKILFSSDFASKLCRKTLGSEIRLVLDEVAEGQAIEVRFGMLPAAKQSAGGENGAIQPAGQPLRVAHTPSPTLPKVAAEQNASVHTTMLKKTSQSLEALSQPGSGSQPGNWGHVIEGESNQMALAALKMALAEPGKVTPIVLQGATGTGKTLLLSSLVQNLRNCRRMRRVIHLTSEQFTNDFTEGLCGGGLPVFRRKYRDVEALLLDDIQFFLGKKSTIAEVRHTVDNLLRCGKLVVLSADRSLNDMEGLGSELLGRLRGGLVVPMFPLNSQMKLAMLEQLTAVAGVNVNSDVLAQLADRIAGDGRLLRGAVHRLAAVASMHQGSLTWEQCWTAVFDLVQAHRPVVRLADIERAVCGMFGLQQDSLQSDRKTRSISQPRMLAMFLARKYTSAAYKEIGDYFGHRRHSTVISAEKTVEQWLQENAKLEGNRSVAVRDAIRHVEAQLQVG